MKVALILSVVALVAVSQPQNFQFAPHPFQPCELMGQDMQCCVPPQFGGCRAPGNMMGRPLPPNYLPPPQFLADVCCKKAQECCLTDETDRMPRFKCCDADEYCTVADKKGTCETRTAADPTTPELAHLDAGGQCPDDGSLPITVRPNEPYRCTFNSEVSGYKCPDDTHCVLDNTNNKNSGVCCRDTQETDKNNVTTTIGCNLYTDCFSCVNNDDDVKAPCGWLSQGSLSNNHPRCVIACDNFPQKSCILPSDGRMCPVNEALGMGKDNATVINTGTCERRCGYTGTGRAAGINNNGNRAPVPSNASAIKKDACCSDYPGDYCCDFWGQMALHCNRGRMPGGPVCGVPVRGTPNALYTPQWEPLGPYVPAPMGSPWPSPYGQFPPYGQPHGYGQHTPPYGPGPMGPGPMGPGPMGPMPYGMPYGGPGPMYGGRGPMPYGGVPMPYGPWRDGEADDSVEVKVKELFFPPPPMFYPVAPPFVPRRVPSVAEVNPSPFVCSCDTECVEYADCCSDVADECQWGGGVKL